MAAKNKFNGRGRDSISRADADLQDLLGLHFQACRRAEEVEEQIQELHAAGKFSEARVLRMHALGIQQGLRAIEAEVRSYVRPAKQPRPSLPAAQRATPAFGRTDAETAPPGASMPASAGAPMLGPADSRGVPMPAAPMLGSARRSLGPDFEAAMDLRVTLEITR
jgi:hypothetical protein